MRKGPGLEYSIIKTLEAGKQIFIISDVSINNYYNIIDIESNTDGFVYKSFIETGDKVEKSKGEMLSPVAINEIRLRKAKGKCLHLQEIQINMKHK